MKQEALYLLGWKAEEAEELLHRQGKQIRLQIAVPTVRQPVEGPLRVIKQEVVEDIWILTACRVTDPYDV